MSNDDRKPKINAVKALEPKNTGVQKYCLESGRESAQALVDQFQLRVDPSALNLTNFTEAVAQFIAYSFQHNVNLEDALNKSVSESVADTIMLKDELAKRVKRIDELESNEILFCTDDDYVIGRAKEYEKLHGGKEKKVEGKDE